MQQRWPHENIYRFSLQSRNMISIPCMELDSLMWILCYMNHIWRNINSYCNYSFSKMFFYTSDKRTRTTSYVTYFQYFIAFRKNFINFSNEKILFSVSIAHHIFCVFFYPNSSKFIWLESKTCWRINFTFISIYRNFHGMEIIEYLILSNDDWCFSSFQQVS